MIIKGLLLWSQAISLNPAPLHKPPPYVFKKIFLVVEILQFAQIFFNSWTRLKQEFE